MSYASDLGLKVGSKIKVIGLGNSHACFSVGDTIELVRDDGTLSPWFKRIGDSLDHSPFSMRTHTWEHYKEEEKDVTFELKAGDKVEVINTGIFCDGMVKVGDVATYDGNCFSCPTWDYTQICYKDFWSKYLKPHVVAKIKFPCCVPTSEIKDQDTFDKIFALFLTNGAEKHETDWEYSMEYGYKYFGVDYDKDTMFYGYVESYSFNDEEDEVTVYSVAELLGLVTKEEPVAEVPVTTIFPIGTEVQIAKDSKYYKENDYANPINTKGILAGNTLNYNGDSHIYRVRWDDETTNCYEVHDLVVWEGAPSVASQEAITERLEDSPSVGIDYSVRGTTASTEPLIAITQEVKYTIVIKGTAFTFTQEELDALAEELLGFTTL